MWLDNGFTCSAYPAATGYPGWRWNDVGATHLQQEPLDSQGLLSMAGQARQAGRWRDERLRRSLPVGGSKSSRRRSGKWRASLS